jgi:hypothetical protein
MTLQDVVDAFKAQVIDIKSWFADGANHLENYEIMQLTLGQAAFTLVVIAIALYIFWRLLEFA